MNEEEEWTPVRDAAAVVRNGGGRVRLRFEWNTTRAEVEALRAALEAMGGAEVGAVAVMGGGALRHLDAQGAAAVAEFVEHCAPRLRQLQRLIIQHGGFGTAANAALVRDQVTRGAAATLTELRLYNCGLVADGIEALARPLQALHVLQKLSLNDNRGLGTAGTAAVVGAVAASPAAATLTELRLFNCGLVADGIEALARPLQALHGLQLLSIDDNNGLGDTGICAIAGAGLSRALRRIGVFRTSFGVPGADALAALSIDRPELEISTALDGTARALLADARGRLRDLELDHAWLVRQVLMLLLGGIGAGKTELARRLMDPDAEPLPPTAEQRTGGVEVHVLRARTHRVDDGRAAGVLDALLPASHTPGVVRRVDGNAADDDDDGTTTLVVLGDIAGHEEYALALDALNKGGATSVFLLVLPLARPAVELAAGETAHEPLLPSAIVKHGERFVWLLARSLSAGERSVVLPVFSHGDVVDGAGGRAAARGALQELRRRFGRVIRLAEPAMLDRVEVAHEERVVTTADGAALGVVVGSVVADDAGVALLRTRVVPQLAAWAARQRVQRVPGLYAQLYERLSDAEERMRWFGGERSVALERLGELWNAGVAAHNAGAGVRADPGRALTALPRGRLDVLRRALDWSGRLWVVLRLGDVAVLDVGWFTNVVIGSLLQPATVRHPALRRVSEHAHDGAISLGDFAALFHEAADEIDRMLEALEVMGLVWREGDTVHVPALYDMQRPADAMRSVAVDGFAFAGRALVGRWSDERGPAFMQGFVSQLQTAVRTARGSGRERGERDELDFSLRSEWRYSRDEPLLFTRYRGWRGGFEVERDGVTLVATMRDDLERLDVEARCIKERAAAELLPAVRLLLAVARRVHGHSAHGGAENDIAEHALSVRQLVHVAGGTDDDVALHTWPLAELARVAAGAEDAADHAEVASPRLPGLSLGTERVAALLRGGLSDGSAVASEPPPLMPEGERPDVFISHHVRSLGDFALALTEALRRRNLRVWLCREMRGGAAWRDEITVAARSARVGVLLMNAAWAESGECVYETNVMLNGFTHGGTPQLLPVQWPELAFDATPLVHGLADNVNFLAVRNGESDEALQRRVAARVQEILQ